MVKQKVELEKKVIRLSVQDDGGRALAFQVTKIINAGFTGRNQVEVQKHIEEGRKAGHSLEIKKTPIFIPKLYDRITTGNAIEVLQNSKSCGEAEPVLLFAKNEIYVGIGSDHPDRDMKDVLASKQIYPNVISAEVWQYKNVKDDWDNLLMQSWVIEDNGERRPYQEARLNLMMSPENLLKAAKDNIPGDMDGALLFMGTTPTIHGNWEYTPGFEARLTNERTGKSLQCKYFLKPISWFVGEVL